MFRTIYKFVDYFCAEILRAGKDLFYLFFPPLCPCCGSALEPSEKFICLDCLCGLSRTGFLSLKGNPMCERVNMLTRTDTQAYALFLFDHENPVRKIIHEFKYQGELPLALHMGMMMGRELIAQGIAGQIDCLVPVPLHERRLKKRGYNQAEILARGIRQVTDIEVVMALQRKKQTHTQVTYSLSERWKNMQGAFSWDTSVRLNGKRIMLIDDVFTTGATLSGCVRALELSGADSVCVYTLATAHY